LTPADNERAAKWTNNAGRSIGRPDDTVESAIASLGDLGGDLRSRRRAVIDSIRSAALEARDPLARGALADAGGRGRLRPTSRDDPPAALRTGPGITVEPHSVSSSGLVASAPLSLQGGPDEQRG